MKKILKMTYLLIAFSLVACSSSPSKTTADMSVRDQYVSATEKKIEIYQDRVATLKDQDRQMAEARIADVKAELKNYKNASYDTVEFHQERIENNLDRIRELTAKAE